MNRKLISFVSAVCLLCAQISVTVFADNESGEKNYNVYEGYNSAKIVNDGTQSNSGFKFLSQSNIKVEAGADYTVTFMAKGSSNVTVRILDNRTWSNIDGKEIKASPNVSNLWKEYSLSFNTGSADNIIIAFVNNTYAKGTVYVDNAALKKAYSDENILPNPGFEMQNNQNGYKWGKWEDPFSIETSGIEMSPEDQDTAPTQKPVAEVEDDYSNPPAGTNGINLYRGHRSLEINASAPETGAIYQDISVSPNKEYVAVFWLKGDSAVNASFEAQDAKTGAVLTSNTAALTASGSWQRAAVEFSSGTASSVSFRINLTASEAGIAYIDDCELFTKYRAENAKRSNLLTNFGFEDGMSGWTAEGKLFGIYTRADGTLGDAAGGVRIMPVGDSITYGVGDSGNNGGYRPRLYEAYRNAGIDTTFVGPNSGKLDRFPKGSGGAGFSGWRINQIAEQIQVWMQSYEPQVIFLKIGTNDILQDKDGDEENYLAENAPERFEALVDMILEQNPEICLYIASIFPLTGSAGAKVNTYNEAVARVAGSKGANVHYIDMHSVLTDSDLGDHVHPTPAGYDKMAAAWFDATKDEIGSMAPADFVPDAGTAHSGSWSINYNPYHVPYYTLLSYEAISQYINVKKNTDYKVEYYVKGDQNVALQTRIQKSSKLTYVWGEQLIAKTIIMGPKWSKVEFTFNSGDTDLVLINFINSCMSTGNGYIDDISVCELGTDENLVKDPGIENGGWRAKFPYQPVFDVSKADFSDRVTVTMNGETLTSLKSGTAQVSVDLSDIGNVGTLITAIYRNGRLIRCAISEPENNAIQSEFEINAEDMADTLKVMLWNSTDKLKPLREAIVIK